nr:MAG TPA: hypothetical protein [Caudoviricetes sp.]
MHSGSNGLTAGRLRVVYKECLCGAYHQWQMDRVAPWVPVRFRDVPLITHIGPVEAL